MGLIQNLIDYFSPQEEIKQFSGLPFVDLSELEIISAPNPELFYPSFSKHVGEKGKVRLLLSVNLEGQVINIKMLESSDYPRLDEAAKKLSWQFLFDDYLYQGKNSAFQTSVEIEFR
jgi:protein TonB